MLLTGVILGGISISQLREDIRQEDRDWSQAVANALAHAVQQDTLEGNRVAVNTVLDGVLEGNAELGYLLVSGFDGKVFASTFEEVPEALKQDHSNCPHGQIRSMVLEQKEYSDISYPLIDELNAHVHVGIDANNVGESINRATRNLLFGLILITLFGILVAFYIGRRITLPLSALNHALKQYGHGESLHDDTSARNVDQEIKELYESFSEMVEERSHTEQLLTERDRQMLALTHAAPIVLFAVDTQGKITLSDGAGLKALNLKPGELVGHSVYELYSDYPVITEAAQAVLERGESRETRIVLNGRIFVSQWTPVRDSSGQITGATGVALDKTDIEQAESELRQFKSTLDQALDCIFMFRANDLKFFYFNQGAMDQV
ncbi:MAG: PAS domain-containing protein, partial [Gammaproteobacteria bacterium]|nr:PAS domain-containing protein [Gammaproteobacteria bacterium]